MANMETLLLESREQEGNLDNKMSKVFFNILKMGNMGTLLEESRERDNLDKEMSDVY